MPTDLSRRKFLALVAFAGLIGGPDSALIGQTDTQSAMVAGRKLEFDVASIRQNKSGPGDAGGDKPHTNFPIGSDDSYAPGGVFSAANLPLISYIIFAYKITTNNRAALLSSVPDWVSTDGFNVEARTDNHEVTKDQMRLMMQSLLAERFKLVAHHETRQVPVFAAMLAKPGALGPQLRQHPVSAPCSTTNVQPSNTKPSTPPTDSAGFPTLCGGFANYIHPAIPSHRRVGGGNLTSTAIVSSFTGLGNLGHPVVDETGLSGGYDFFLEYLPEPPPGQELPPDSLGPTFQQALKEQLGLKLVAQKAPIDFVIVDHVERPSEN
jgi:uncharacterized protein (TIGR03435 family)